MARLIDADMTYRKLSCIMMQALEHSDEEMNEAMKGYNPSSFVEGFHHAKERILKILDSQTTVDAVEVVHGEWIKHKINPEAMRLFHQDGIAEAMGENSIFWTCSECKSWGTPAHKYCQNCGAKMDGGDE